MTHDNLGQIYAIGTAFVWAFALVFFKFSGERIVPLALNLFKNSIGLALLAVTHLALWLAGCDRGFGELADCSRQDIIILLISGFIGIALADTVFFRSLNLIGVGIVAIVDCLYSPSVIFFAAIMLGESMGGWQYLGAALIISAVLSASRLKPPRDRTHAQLVAGILLGALAMLLMGFGIVLAKPVLAHFPLMWAVTIRMVAGTLSLALLAAAARQRRLFFSPFRPSGVWRVAIPGSFLGAYISLVLWVAGFKYTDASIAGALNQTSTIFAILAATLILKEHFDRRKLLAVTLAVAGVLLVSLAGPQKTPDPGPATPAAAHAVAAWSTPAAEAW